MTQVMVKAVGADVTPSGQPGVLGRLEGRDAYGAIRIAFAGGP
jgi:hypothetical protein